MTEPGPMGKGPIKVVPIYFDVPATVPVDTVEAEDAPPEPAGPKSPLLAAVAIGFAVVAGVLQGFAIGVATDGDYPTSSLLAYLAISVSVVAMVLSVAAILLKRGRRWGFVGAVLAIIANPVLLLGLLRFFASLTT